MIPQNPTAAAELNRAAERFPLPPGWSTPELFTEQASIGGLELRLAGLVSKRSDGTAVTGSAASAQDFPVARAYFELIERTCTIDAEQRHQPVWLSRTQTGEATGELPQHQVFPQEDSPGFRYSKSNGVAAGQDWAAAAVRARLELIERDTVLRSWFGQGTPRKLDNSHINGAFQVQALAGLYDCSAWAFPLEAATADAHVVGAFAFPVVADAPVVFGFAARNEFEAATDSAAQECLQRLGFLWGESIEGEPPMEATPDTHQEYYAHRDRISALRSWLDGEHEGMNLIADRAPDFSLTLFVDLTPPSLEGKLAISKALCIGAMPLTFGPGHPLLNREPPPAVRLHPIA